MANLLSTVKDTIQYFTPTQKMSDPSDLPMTKFWRFTLLPTSSLPFDQPTSTNSTHQLFAKMLAFCRSATANQTSAAHGHALFQVIDTGDPTPETNNSDSTSNQTFVLMTGYPSLTLNEATDQEYFDSGLMAEMFGLVSHGGLWLAKDCDVTKLGVDVSANVDTAAGLVSLEISEGDSQACSDKSTRAKTLILQGEEMEQGKAIKLVTIALRTATSVEAGTADRLTPPCEIHPISSGHALEMTLKRIM